MSAVDIFTAPRMKQIEDTTVVGGLIDLNGNLLLSTRAGEEINAGNVVGPQGSGFTYRGVWAEATSYAVDDVVTSNGSTFVVTAEHTSSTTTPTVDVPGANLALWAKKGQDGTVGLDGMPGDSTIPAGTISLWVGDVAPTNWMICDGSAVSRTTYASLFSVIDIKYGAGDGVNTFNLPNLKGKTPVGLDTSQTEFNTLAKIGGEKAHLLTTAEMPSHTHGFGTGVTVAALAAGATAYFWNAPTGPDRAYGISATASTGGGTAHNILQPYAVVNFIIKVTNGDTPGDSQLTQRVSDLEATFSATPAGTITAWGSDIAPTNWLMCDGAAVSRAIYASLFSAIGTKFGAGDGLNTFNLPNLKGRVPVGRDAAQTEFDVLGETGGAKTHTLTVAEMPSHQHTTKININTVNSRAAGSAQYNVDNAGTDLTTATGGGAAHNNLQPYQVVNYIIKITNGDTKGDSQLTDRVSQLEAKLNAYGGLALRDRMTRAQQVLSGGGIRKVGTSGVFWDNPFSITGAGWENPSLSGYWEIAHPPNGTVIPVYGHPTVTSVTTFSSTIPLTPWQTLYYELPLDQGYASVPGRFRIIDDLVKMPFTPPPNWIMIVCRNDNVRIPGYVWGDGRKQDWWKALTLLNGWTFYGAGYAWPDWRYRDDGSIQLRGLMRSGTGVAFTKFADVNGPDQAILFDVVAVDGNARIDVTVDGTCNVIRYTAGGSSAYVSLDQISWYPKGS